jgi:hypothetical protein
MASYMEDLARWRVERKQAQIADRVNQIADEYREAMRERDRAIADGDTETASFRDDDCIQLESEYLQYCPPRPQMDPAAAQWIRENKAFFERHGPNADAAVRAAHAWLTRPGNAGWKVNSPEYFKAVESLLETDGPSRFGVRYDPNEKELNANEAARVSGVSAKTYNNASRQLAAQGRFSWQNRK